ncbi:MAG: acyl-CoA dehydratase activase [Dehalococcoidales bacterium]|nr:acyl-CoA dehydratase activase [Dehalococcoidales bacterium]
MITAGIDVGIENIKVVLLRDGTVIGTGMARSGGADRKQAVEQIWQDTLAAAGLNAGDVSKVVATGQGKGDVSFAADRITEPLADALAAAHLYAQARSVVDVGADQVRVVTLDGKGGIAEVVLNQKCAAGIGTFLRSVARRLGYTLEEMSGINSTSGYTGVVNDACCLFAEMDALNLLHDGVAPADIAGAIHRSMAVRISSVMHDKIMPDTDTTVLIGGVARNPAVVAALRERSGIDFMIPDQPEYAGALGAALEAAA